MNNVALSLTDCKILAKALTTVLLIWDKVARPTKAEKEEVAVMWELADIFHCAKAGTTFKVIE